MFPPEKIEEWILEARQRPSSAPIIIQYIANRLRDLSEWNEKLRIENLELRSGQRVEEYERTITHLEYQLDLLKRQVSGEIDLNALAESPLTVEPKHSSLLVYGPGGRVARVEMDPEWTEEDVLVCRFDGLVGQGEEPPRILVVSSSEELVFIFTSGRIIAFPVAALPLSQVQQDGISWEDAYVPEEPNLGETLACVVPVSRMALADFFLQVSRRGYAKKIRTALAPTIMDNKFIGTGVKVPADQTMTLMMGNMEDRFVLVSYEGYLQCIPEDILPYAIVEAMRLGKTDHLVAAFPAKQDVSILVMTQIGKVIHRTSESLEVASDLARKGSMLYTTARREAGVRVVGAGEIHPEDWALALHREGQVTRHAVSTLIGEGAIDIYSELLDFVIYRGSQGEG